MKRTYQPNTLWKKRTHGFRERMKTKGGRLVLKRRRARGRKKLSAQQAALVAYFFHIAGWIIFMYNLSKNLVLKKNKNFQTVYRLGKSYANRMLVVYILKRNDQHSKVGFAAGKKLGNAVTRNRVKRLLREVYRLNQFQLIKGIDLLLVGRKNLTTVKYTVAEKAFLDIAKKANILE